MVTLKKISRKLLYRKDFSLKERKNLSNVPGCVSKSAVMEKAFISAFHREIINNAGARSRFDNPSSSTVILPISVLFAVNSEKPPVGSTE